MDVACFTTSLISNKAKTDSFGYLLWVRCGVLVPRRSEERFLCPSLKEGDRKSGYTDMKSQKMCPRIWHGSRTIERGQLHWEKKKKPILACLQESFIAKNRCSKPQWNLDPTWFGVWCWMISFPHLWIEMSGSQSHLTVWCGSRDKWYHAKNGKQQYFAILMNPYCASQCPLNHDN